RRGPALVEEILVPIEIAERILQLRLIAIARRSHLVKLCLIGARVDLREEIAGLYALAFGECDLRDLPLDLAANDNSIVGVDRTEAAQQDLYSRAGNRAGDDGNRRGRWGRRCRLNMSTMGEIARAQGDGHCGRQKDEPPAHDIPL